MNILTKVAIDLRQEEHVDWSAAAFYAVSLADIINVGAIFVGVTIHVHARLELQVRLLKRFSVNKDTNMGTFLYTHITHKH
jgi:hypothetical protein